MPFSRPSFLFQLSVTEPFRAYLGVSDRLTSTESFLTFRSPYGSLLRIDIVSTWGSRRFASLDRLQFVDPYSRVIPPSYLHVFSDPLPLDANDRPCLEAIDGLVADNLTAAPQEWRQWRPWRTHYRDCSAVRRGSASLRDKTSSLYVLFDVFEGELSSGHARERMPQTILFVNKFGLVENDGLQTDENRI